MSRRGSGNPPLRLTRPRLRGLWLLLLLEDKREGKGQSGQHEVAHLESNGRHFTVHRWAARPLLRSQRPHRIHPSRPHRRNERRQHSDDENQRDDAGIHGRVPRLGLEEQEHHHSG